MKSKICLIAAVLLVMAMQNVLAQYEVPQEGLVPPSQDLLVWVTSYSPPTIRSDLLEDIDVPVTVNLKGIQINPFINIPVITRVSLRPTAVLKQKVTENYIRPAIPTLDDLGRVIVTVKRIPTEAQMPDSIEVNVSALIEYSYEDVLGFGQKDLVLDIVNEKEWNENDWKYEFWDNSGFLRLANMDNQKASIILYDSSKNEIKTIGLSAGQKSDPYFMNVHGKGGWVTVQLNSIDTPSPYAKVTVDIEGKKSSSILRANYPLFAGSEWKVTSVDAKIGGGGSITIRNSKGEQKSLSIDTRTIKINQNGELIDKTIGESISGTLFVGWITSTQVYIINTSKPDNALKYIRDEIKNKGLNNSVFDNAKSQNLISDYYTVSPPDTIKGTSIKLESITAPEYSTVLDDPTAKKYFDAALEQYTEIASGFEAEARNDTRIPMSYSDDGYIKYNQSWPESALYRAYEFTGGGVKKYYQAKSVEFLNALIQRYPDSSDKAGWQRALASITNFNYANAHTFIDDKGRSVSVMLESVEIPELTSSTSLIVKGLQGDYKEGQILDSEWYVEKITEKDVTFRKAVTNQLEPITIGTEKELNKTMIKVLSTKVQKEAYVTISPYHRDGQTTTNFTLFLPIEKRGIQLTPDQINGQIKSADDQIKQLDRITTDMGNTITGLKNTCFATYGILTVKKLITDWSGIQGKATNIVMRGIDGKSGWIKLCEDKIASERKGGIFYKSVQDCLNENAKEILAQTDVAKTILQQTANISQYFNSSGDIIDYAGLKSQFVDPKIQDYIANQKYMNDKFGASELTRKDIEELFLYQGLGGQQSDSGIYTQSKNEYEALKTSYTKNNEIISTLKTAIPDSATVADYNSLTNSNDVRRRQNALQLARDNAELASKPAEKTATLLANVIEFEKSGDAYKYYASIPSISATRVEVIKEGDKYFYMRGTEKVPITLKQECAGKTTETTLRTYSSTKYNKLPALVPFSKGWTKIDEYDQNNVPKKMTIHITTPIATPAGIGGCYDIIYVEGEDMNSFEDADKAIIRSATQCVKEALAAVKTKKTGDMFSCDNRQFSIGTDYAERAEQNYCEDFFSAGDCNILYQVCDPVICPASRCDFGGRWKVGDVVQSGIFGSILLCAPNFPTPVIAVCLPGIRAGLLGYESVLKGYKSCLQTHLETGQTVGVCDRLTSLYWCDLLWKTVLSMYDDLGGFYGIISGAFDKTKGGGELINAYSGLQEAEKSLNYFASVYAEDTFARFRDLKTEQVGGYICQRAIYGTVPTSMDIFADISKVNAPPQFFGHVEESAYAVINTPQSHYKVYYHIYAGEEKGIYYQVYLSAPISSAFYTTPLQKYPLDAGYLDKGAFLDKTPDFIASSGYTQLCIDIDGVPYCGFGWVSSEMLVQELSDSYTKSLASSNIQNADECIFSRATTILQGTQALQRSGIKRICSSGDPNAGKGTRVWEPVGWCDKQANIECWLDESSVETAIKDLKIEQETLADAEAKVADMLKQVYATSQDAKSKLNDSYSFYLSKDYDKSITLAQQVIDQTAPIETYLIDEARFIIGLSNERLFENKKMVLDKQSLTTESKKAAACTDKIKNQDETDIDCGGAVCPKCAVGKSCLKNSDCDTNNCSSGKCAAQPAAQILKPLTTEIKEISDHASAVEASTHIIITGFVIYYPKNNESLLDIINKFYLTSATPEREARVLDFNCLSTPQSPTAGNYEVIVSECTLKTSDIKTVIDVTINPDKIKFIVLPMHSDEQKAFESAYLNMPSCDKTSDCSKVKFQITDIQESQNRAYYTTRYELCYSKGSVCSSCSDIRQCSDLSKDWLKCNNLTCSSWNSNMPCTYEDQRYSNTEPASGICFNKSLDEDYNVAIGVNTADSLNSIITKYPTSLKAFDCAKRIYSAANDELSAGKITYGISDLEKIGNAKSQGNVRLQRVIDNANAIKSAYSSSSGKFDSFYNSWNNCANSVKGNCRCQSLDFEALTNLLTSVSALNPQYFGNKEVISSSVPGFYDAPVANFYITLEGGQMKLIDGAHSNAVVKSSALAKGTCFFKTSFVMADLQRVGINNIAQYFEDITNMNPSQIKIDRNAVGTKDVLIDPYYKMTADLFNFNSQNVCFVTGTVAEFEANIGYC